MLATLSANEERMAGWLKLPKGEGEVKKGGVSPARGSTNLVRKVLNELSRKREHQK